MAIKIYYMVCHKSAELLTAKIFCTVPESMEFHQQLHHLLARNMCTLTHTIYRLKQKEMDSGHRYSGCLSVLLTSDTGHIN